MRWMTAAVLLVLAGPAQAQDKAQMCNLADKLLQVARMVDAYASANPSARTLKGAELIDKATSHDPAAMEPLRGYSVDARIEGPNSSVLVCLDGRALLEDAGCTARADKHVWVQRYSCGFSLDLEEVCSGRAPARREDNPCR